MNIAKRVLNSASKLFKSVGVQSPCPIIMIDSDQYMEYLEAINVSPEERLASDNALAFYDGAMDLVFVIIDRLVYFNDNFITHVLAHEFGHAFGLDHINNSLMAPTVLEVQPIKNTIKEFKDLIYSECGREINQI